MTLTTVIRSRSLSVRMRPWIKLFLNLTVTCLMSSIEAASILPSRLKSTDSNRISNGNGAGLRNTEYQPGTRPLPSDELPVGPLFFPTDKEHLPTDRDLNPHVLQKLLGHNFDPHYMSPVHPIEPNGTFVYDFKKSMPVDEMPEDIKNLAFTLPGRNKKIKVKSKSNRRRMQRFLSTYSYCPVLYQWRDLGQRFWPRWIKEGQCKSLLEGGRSCSIPAGMTCKRSVADKKTILWWHCRREYPCEWIEIQYPIITKCTCSCLP